MEEVGPDLVEPLLEALGDAAVDDIDAAFDRDRPLAEAWWALHTPYVPPRPAGVADVLARLAGDANEMLDLPSGSVGALLRAGGLDGMTARVGAAVVRVDRVRPRFLRRHGRIELGWWCTLGAGEAARRITIMTPAPATLRRKALAETRSHAAEALAALVAAEGERIEHSLDDLARELGPTAPAGLAAWLLERGSALIADAPPFAAAARGDRRWELASLVLKEQGGHLQWTVRFTSFEREAIASVVEQTLYYATLEAELHEAPVPVDEGPAVRAIAALRAAAAARLDRLAPGDPTLMPTHLELASPLALPALWLTEGPPGLRPPPAPPPISFDDATIARAAFALRPLAGPLAAVCERVDALILASFELDGWVIHLAPDHGDHEGFSHDRILLEPPDGEALEIMRNDPWNGHVMAIDGDAVLLGHVARFLREVVAASGMDIAFVRPRGAEEQEEDEDRERLTLVEWLRFPDPLEPPSAPSLDHRLDPEPPEPVAFWHDGPFEMTRAERAAYQAGITTHYHRFVREIIDPTFVPPLTSLLAEIISAKPNVR